MTFHKGSIICCPCWLHYWRVARPGGAGAGTGSAVTTRRT
jgi:hypothetical protein